MLLLFVDIYWYFYISFLKKLLVIILLSQSFYCSGHNGKVDWFSLDLSPRVDRDHRHVNGPEKPLETPEEAPGGTEGGWGELWPQTLCSLWQCGGRCQAHCSAVTEQLTRPHLVGSGAHKNSPCAFLQGARPRAAVAGQRVSHIVRLNFPSFWVCLVSELQLSWVVAG